jgi:hypothetical protein
MVSYQTLIASTVGLFLVFLPLWMFCSSFQAIALLVAAGCASVYLVLTTYGDAKATDAYTQVMAPLAEDEDGDDGGSGSEGDGVDGAGGEGKEYSPRLC